MEKEQIQDNISGIQEQKEKQVLKKDNKLILVIVHIIFIGIVLAVIAYLYVGNTTKDSIIKKQKAEIATLSSQNEVIKGPVVNSETQSKVSDVVTSTNLTSTVVNNPNETVISNIKASINTANTQLLEGYMATSVNVILAATEAYGVQTQSQAASHIATFIGDPTKITWDFNLGASVISSYGQGSYGQYFPIGATIGKSSDNKVISISYDANGKIYTVFMAANENLLQ